MMFASLHSEETIPCFNDKLNTIASDILICFTVSISSFGGIASSVPVWVTGRYVTIPCVTQRQFLPCARLFR